MNRRYVVILILGFGCLPFGSAAAAQSVTDATHATPSAEQTRSDALFLDGVRLSNEGNLYSACESFEESYRLAPRPGILLNVGICHQGLGQLLRARHELLEARRTLSEREGLSKRVSTANEKLREIEAALGWIHVAPIAAQAGAITRLRLDGAVVALVPNQPLPVMPGEHTVRLEADGYEAYELSVAVGRGVHTNMVFEPLRRVEPSVAFSPSQLQPQPTPAFTAAEPVHSARSDFATPRVAALVVGVVGIATSLAFGAWALERKSVLDDRCHNRMCSDPNDLQIADTGRSVALVSSVAFGAGVVGLATWVFLPGGLFNQSVSAIVSDRGRVGLTLRGTF